MSGWRYPVRRNSSLVTKVVFTVLATSVVVGWWLIGPDHGGPPSSETGLGGGEMNGYVERVDLDARTIAVSRTAFGFGAVVISVTNDTRILVHDLHGGFGDLVRDAPVSVSFVVRGTTRVATSIRVGSDTKTYPQHPVLSVVDPPATDIQEPTRGKPLTSIGGTSAATATVSKKPHAAGGAAALPATNGDAGPTGAAPHRSTDSNFVGTALGNWTAAKRTGRSGERDAATGSAIDTDDSREDGSSVIDWLLAHPNTR